MADHTSFRIDSEHPVPVALVLSMSMAHTVLTASWRVPVLSLTFDRQWRLIYNTVTFPVAGVQ